LLYNINEPESEKELLEIIDVLKNEEPTKENT